MNFREQFASRARRDFLTTSASGLGLAALTSMLNADGLMARTDAAESAVAAGTPMAVRAPHFAPKAKNCIPETRNFKSQRRGVLL